MRRNLKEKFARLRELDNVVIAGFGRFGQSVVEQLRLTQGEELAHVVIIDQDAERRMMVVEEQEQLQSNFDRSVLRAIYQSRGVAASRGQGGFRAAKYILFARHRQWERQSAHSLVAEMQKYPKSQVFARSNAQSRFASSVADEKTINAFSINGLLEDMIPVRWTRWQILGGVTI